ncbi:hypothetical protein CH063_13108 [Colletotrichum higginsianum]|uniref:Uncharacterized protein n=1 Tax=Colletotrichum higginsianum (strain IMI 349063) TaxID=759273 RepID=H1VT40_COLHI|nr:hypothetical protein CH063_13108 [Colletotrichum higginsianum]
MSSDSGGDAGRLVKGMTVVFTQTSTPRASSRAPSSCKALMYKILGLSTLKSPTEKCLGLLEVSKFDVEASKIVIQAATPLYISELLRLLDLFL